MARRTSLLGGGSSSALRALCQRALSSTDFRSALRAPLWSLIEFDAYCVNTCDVETGVVTSSVGDGLSPEHARVLFALEAEGKDFNSLRELHQGPKRIASMWQSTVGELARSPRMRQIFVPLGFGDELRAALTVDGACFGYLHLFRRASLGPFLPAELRRLEPLMLPIAAALRRAAATDAARSNDGEAPSPSLLVLDANNRLVRHSEAATTAVAGLDRLRVTSGSAHVLQDLASRARAGARPRATLLRAGAAPRSLSAVRLGDQTAVLIDDLKAEHGRALLAISAGLTPRERKVSACIARGDANLAIAAELGISLHTVKDHVKAILLKTRCASRSELAARWNGARS
jgi:DNA-binding CsgD family transcriptional regulator